MPGDERLRPRRGSVGYCIRRPLVRWLERQSYEGLRVLDVGCGDRPYDPIFCGAAELVGFDRAGNSRADVHGDVDAIPVADGSFDLVVCLQVLEHVPDPAAAVQELRRVVRPGGRVLASTHGVHAYHPNPEDLWRWTHSGLERLFVENGPWSEVKVEPGAGSAATAAMVVAHLLDLLFKRAHIRPLGRPVVAALNAIGEGVDHALPELASTRPGTFAPNYHVAATA